MSSWQWTLSATILVLLPHDSFNSGTNFALNKPTFALSQLTLYGHTSAAVNGDSNTYLNSGTSCTHTNPGEKDPWWVVDMQMDIKPRKVTVLNRSDCCAERLHDFHVALTQTNPTLVAPTPTNSDLCATYTGVVGAGEKVQLDCAPDVHGRYLIVQIPGPSEVLSLCEVEVFGEIANIYSSVSQHVRIEEGLLGSEKVVSHLQCIHLCMSTTFCRAVNVKMGSVNHEHLDCELCSTGDATPVAAPGWQMTIVK